METATELSHITTLADSWELHLRAERKSPATLDNYTSAVERLTDYLTAQGMPTDLTRINREHIEAFIVHLLDTRSPATALNRFKALQQYFRWLDAPVRSQLEVDRELARVRTTGNPVGAAGQGVIAGILVAVRVNHSGSHRADHEHGSSLLRSAPPTP